MAKLTPEELSYLAQLSAIKLDKQELTTLTEQVTKVLDYAAQLQQVSHDREVGSIRNVNMMRDDVILPFDGEALLEQAPERRDRYFVVPKILD